MRRDPPVGRGWGRVFPGHPSPFVLRGRTRDAGSAPPARPGARVAGTGVGVLSAGSGCQGEVGTYVQLPRKPLGGFVAGGLLRTLDVIYFDGLHERCRTGSFYKEKSFYIVLLTWPFYYWNSLLKTHFEERRLFLVSRLCASASLLLRLPMAKTREVLLGKLHLSLMTMMCPFPVSEVEKQYMCVKPVPIRQPFFPPLFLGLQTSLNPRLHRGLHRVVMMLLWFRGCTPLMREANAI